MAKNDFRLIPDGRGGFHRQIDGDTEADNQGNRFRYGGINTREIATVKKDKYGEASYKPSQLGAMEQAKAVSDIIRIGKFNNVEYTGNYDERGREIINRYNDDGADLNEVLIANGIAEPDLYTSSSALLAKRAAEDRSQLYGTRTDYQKLGDTIQDKFDSQGINFKGRATSEAYYDPDFHSGVMFRDTDRDLENNRKGFFGQAGSSFYQSWQGIKEGFYGYMQATGQVSDFEALDNVGMQGVLRARETLRQQPHVVLDYREVDGVFKGFQYVMNNAAMSAPYMASTMAAMVLAAPLAAASAPLLGPAAGAVAIGATAVPNSLIFAGQIWNEMEGEKGAAQWAAATAGGVSMSVLERFGLSKLLPKTSLINAAGLERASQALVTRVNKEAAAGKLGGILRPGSATPVTPITLAQARNHLKNAVASEQRRMMKSMGDFRPEDIMKFSGLALAKNTARGAAIESATEIMQESIQMATAAGVSDKRYTPEEIKNRLLNAGIAGGTLGGTFSGIGAGRQQLKNYLEYKEKADDADPEKAGIMAQHKQRRIQAGHRITSVEEDIAAVDAGIKAENERQAENVDVVEPMMSPKEIDDQYVVDNAVTTEEKKTVYQGISDAVKLTQKEIDAKAAKIETEQGAKAANLYRKAVAAKQGRIQEDKDRPVELAPTPLKTAAERAKAHEESSVGAGKFVSKYDKITDYLGAFGLGALNLVRGAEKATMEIREMLKSEMILSMLAFAGQLTTGRYKSGDNHRAYKDKLEGGLRSMISQAEIIDAVMKVMGIKGNRRVNAKNAKLVSGIILWFGKSGAFDAFRQYKQDRADGKDAVWDEDKEWFNPADKKAGGRKYTIEQVEELYKVGLKFEAAYDAVWETIREAYKAENKDGKELQKLDGYWYKHDGFDWQKVRNNPTAFKAWVIKNNIINLGQAGNQAAVAESAEALWQSIALRGEASFGSEFSLVEGKTWLPWSFNKRSVGISEMDGFSQWASTNIFETLVRSQREAAKYASSTKYFGHGGHKLDYMMRVAQAEGGYTDEQMEKFAYHLISMINSEHGNFNRVKSPLMTKINSFLTGWSVFAGLTLSAPASLPEMVMIYWRVHDDTMFRQATDKFYEQVGALWSKQLQEEVKRSKAYLIRTGLTQEQSAAIDRLATGEKDIYFLRAHEAFFTTIGLTSLTQFQRRMNAAFAIDYVRSSVQILAQVPMKDYAPERIKGAVDTSKDDSIPGDTEGNAALAEGAVGQLGFDFDKMSKEELRVYEALSDLGVDVEGLVLAYQLTDEIHRDSLFNIEGERNDEENIQAFGRNSFRQALESRLSIDLHTMKDSLSPAQLNLVQDAKSLQDFLNDQMETAIYNFVNERIQNPQSANRPLFFQDPHWQLMTQFNGFISTFTSVIIPRLYKTQLAKGTAKVKYDTFAFMVMMLVLGGASQYIKDLIKFGKPSPYLDSAGYMQRALYASGVLGQFERVVDQLAPLYPDRNGWLLSALGGETGPSARNIRSIGEGVGALLEGDTELAAKKVLTTAPALGSINRMRDSTVDIMHLKSPRQSSGYDESWVKDLIDMVN